MTSVLTYSHHDQINLHRMRVRKMGNRSSVPQLTRLSRELTGAHPTPTVSLRPSIDPSSSLCPRHGCRFFVFVRAWDLCWVRVGRRYVDSAWCALRRLEDGKGAEVSSRELRSPSTLVGPAGVAPLWRPAFRFIWQLPTDCQLHILGGLVSDKDDGCGDVRRGGWR